MAFREVASLDADTTVALGKRDKVTGKLYPTKAEGYYLGNRQVQNKRGASTLHFLQTPKGNLGVWGTTDLDRKLSVVKAGTMVEITSTGTKATKNGDMYTYRVRFDEENTIEVELSEAAPADDTDSEVTEDDGGNEEASDEDTFTSARGYAAGGGGGGGSSQQDTAALAAERKKKVEELLRGGVNKNKAKS